MTVGRINVDKPLPPRQSAVNLYRISLVKYLLKGERAGMPKICCPCGFVHDLSVIPDKGWQTTRDESFDAMLDAEIALRHLNAIHAPFAIETHQQHTKLIAASTGILYECPNCGRLMWKKPLSADFVVYAVDESMS